MRQHTAVSGPHIQGLCPTARPMSERSRSTNDKAIKACRWRFPATSGIGIFSSHPSGTQVRYEST